MRISDVGVVVTVIVGTRKNTSSKDFFSNDLICNLNFLQNFQSYLTRSSEVKVCNVFDVHSMVVNKSRRFDFREWLSNVTISGGGYPGKSWAIYRL
uniref:C3H1-type domain-containing protein n=1 Tax=Parascaris univalens TaxID=6257 RepID=A0A915AY07_PARUN